MAHIQMRVDQEIGPEAIEEVLSKAMVGRVGVISEGEPYVVPMNFAHKGNRFFIHGAESGRFIGAIRSGGRVCFEVDEYIETISDPVLCQYDTRYLSVIGFGTARVIEDLEEKTEALRVVASKYSTDEKGMKLHETTVEKYRATATESPVVVFEMTLDQITGKANP